MNKKLVQLIIKMLIEIEHDKKLVQLIIKMLIEIEHDKKRITKKYNKELKYNIY